MFPFPIAKPQNCDIQTFYGTNGSSGDARFTWNKPVGVSHVYMMLIGAGGNNTGTGVGGGSGAVTVWYGAAQHVPNNLLIQPGSNSGSGTNIYYWSSSQEKVLLSANAASGVNGGTATTAGPFAASGFYASKTGAQGGGATISASADTFLSGGGNLVNANYGYSTSRNGFFQMQPIIVGAGGAGNDNGGIGCGAGNSVGAVGGPGMVLIASW
jgi:hypothetical protein